MLSLAKLRSTAPIVAVLAGAAAALYYHLRIARLDTPALILVCLLLSPLLATIFESISWGDATLRFRIRKNEERHR